MSKYDFNDVLSACQNDKSFCASTSEYADMLRASLDGLEDVVGQEMTAGILAAAMGADEYGLNAFFCENFCPDKKRGRGWEMTLAGAAWLNGIVAANLSAERDGASEEDRALVRATCSTVMVRLLSKKRRSAEECTVLGIAFNGLDRWTHAAVFKDAA